MPYHARQRKQPEKFQVFQAGDSHVPVSLWVEKARSRKKDRERKTMKDGTEDKAKLSVLSPIPFTFLFFSWKVEWEA